MREKIAVGILVLLMVVICIASIGVVVSAFKQSLPFGFLMIGLYLFGGIVMWAQYVLTRGK